jgi:hypothetical protein
MLIGMPSITKKEVAPVSAMACMSKNDKVCAWFVTDAVACAECVVLEVMTVVSLVPTSFVVGSKVG